MRWAVKPDENQREIIDALEKIGCSVVSLHRVGSGIPDLLVGRRGWTTIIEVKTLAGKLNKKQQEFHELWRGSIYVASTPEEAIRIMQNGPKD